MVEMVVRSRHDTVAHRLAFGDARPMHRALFNVKESCVLAARTYVPRVYAGRVTLFRAQQGALIRERVRRGAWKDLADGVDIREVPGNHLTMLADPHVRVLAEELRSYLQGGKAFPIE